MSHHCIGLARQNNTNILLLWALRRFTLPLALHCSVVHWNECWAGQDLGTLLLGTHTQFITPRLGHCYAVAVNSRTEPERLEVSTAVPPVSRRMIISPACACVLAIAPSFGQRRRDTVRPVECRVIRQRLTTELIPRFIYCIQLVMVLGRFVWVMVIGH